MEQAGLKRFGISMEGRLLQRFDHLVTRKGYTNRSEAIRDLVRDAIIQHSWEEEEELVAGSILLFYNHHQRNLMEELTRIQHRMHDVVLATTHFHLDHDNCLETIIVKGKVKDIQTLSNQLTSLKGVEYGKFTVAPVEKI
ncbi:nickel-responsive transcriptional regulator NikR [Lederbergia galactosidilytica]|uniref:Putative nickel-responsive regulator n=1 Tax=Lederbergia galactosidilytica TaxID=217031 RepID=A0A177ZKK7_9BACI|nr:nickel-responsive transcriptional regulator NikR [Lederbergia galactosidilytica]KRG15714.1 nickel-responsive regulator [Virgibacillus soli]MBP1916804.1 CopG family nickel-responsive transcriptional regulator [Lederbergia galactosidilytica]OAK68516.1 nickel-responsive regulator [Lederbergia galactosidilytica]